MNIRTLERVKRQWQSAADLMPQLICLVNAEGRLLHANRTMEWWGLGKVTDARGREVHEILHRGCDDPDCYFRRLWDDATRARLEGRRVAHEVFDPLLERHFAIRIQPLVWRSLGDARSVDDLHTIVVVDDISDLKQAEAGIMRRNEELAQQVAEEVGRRALSEEMQERLLTILEKTTDYVAMADASESMLYLNPAARSMLGLGPTDDISHAKLCDHADREIQDTLRQVAIPAAVENGLWSGESRMRDRTGREIHTSQVIIAHHGADGRVDCLSTILRDISTRVQAEQALLESREESRQLAALLVSIQEDERRRIALDLHDGLGQSLSLIKLALDTAVEQAATGAADAVLDSLRRIALGIRDAMHEVRRVSTDLHPAILDDLGILPTLSWFFRELEAVCGATIAVEKSLTVGEREIPAPLKITLYRVIQEATSNIVRHACADRMHVRLYRADDALHLEIEDNGRGFDPAGAMYRPGERHGLGLVSMKERVTLSGGSYCLSTSPGGGTRIHASWPLA